MSHIKISTIIPAYNVETYIQQAIDSILNQTLDNIEIIIVDDGSTDSTPTIIDEYAKKYPQCHTYHQKNQGQATARNQGLKHAQGEYITFLDADDYIPPDAYEKLYNTITQENTDIITGNCLRFNNKGTFKSGLYNNVFPENFQKIPSTHIKEYHNLVYDTGIWKLIKKSFLDKHHIKFAEGLLYEDLLFSIQLHYLAESVSLVPDIVYYWRMREEENSTTQKLTTLKNLNDRFTIINKIYNFTNKNKITDELLEAQYEKWLKQDIMLFINEYLYADEEFQKQLITKTNQLLNKLPKNIINRLNFINRLKYKQIQKNNPQKLTQLLSIYKIIKLSKKKTNIKMMENR